MVEQVIFVNESIYTPAQKREYNAQQAYELPKGMVGDDVVVIGGHNIFGL
jgi:hypothetical protein